MTIDRIINGERVNIELTPDELTRIFWEQQKIFDRQDILSYLNDQYLENHDDVTMEQLEPLIPDIVSRYRKKIDNGALDWWDIAEEAIDYIRKGEGV